MAATLGACHMLNTASSILWAPLLTVMSLSGTMTLFTA